jgi:hydroxyacyl-ACP dehydratase HTD2-like protein with hotdog domain
MRAVGGADLVMSGLLSAELLANIGKQAPPRTEVVTKRDIRKYSIATDQRQRKYLDGDEAPPLYHLALFWDVVELDELTPDGVSIDKLLPKFPLERAMAGGLNIQYHDRIRAGDTLIGTRTLTDIYEKEGRSGPLIFYEVVLEIVRDDGTPVITEKTTRILR